MTYEFNIAVLDSTPPTSILNIATGRSSSQLTLSYNTMYRVRFVATRCGLSSTNIFILNYGKICTVYTTCINITFCITKFKYDHVCTHCSTCS